MPALPGELGELASAMGTMREKLDRRAEVEQGMRTLTHELKSPLAAIGGAAELLHDEQAAARVVPSDDTPLLTQKLRRRRGPRRSGSRQSCR